MLWRWSNPPGYTAHWLGSLGFVPIDLHQSHGSHAQRNNEPWLCQFHRKRRLSGSFFLSRYPFRFTSCLWLFIMVYLTQLILFFKLLKAFDVTDWNVQAH